MWSFLKCIFGKNNKKKNRERRIYYSSNSTYKEDIDSQGYLDEATNKSKKEIFVKKNDSLDEQLMLQSMMHSTMINQTAVNEFIGNDIDCNCEYVDHNDCSYDYPENNDYCSYDDLNGGYSSSYFDN